MEIKDYIKSVEAVEDGMSALADFIFNVETTISEINYSLLSVDKVVLIDALMTLVKAELSMLQAIYTTLSNVEYKY